METYNRDLLLEPLFTVQQLNIGEYPQSPAERVRKWAFTPDRQIFCEMMELSKTINNTYSWYEKARWIKFEETVEDSKQRWSKPRIPLLSLQSMFQLKNCIKRGTILFDVDVSTFPEIVDRIVKSWIDEHFITAPATEPIKSCLLSNKEHLYKLGLKGKLSSFVAGRKISREMSHASELDKLDNEHILQINAEVREAELRMNELTKKLTDKAEVAVIFVGRVKDCVRKPLSCFLRVAENRSILQTNSSEVQRPLRFVFVLLVPDNHEEEELDMVGRALGAMLTDDLFLNVAYQAQSYIDLLAGFEAFMSNILIIPPGKWNRDVRLEPNEAVTASVKKRAAPHQKSLIKMTKSVEENCHFEGLQFSGRVFGGLLDDIKRKVPFYVSDYKDAFSSVTAISQCVASSLFLFFVNLTNIVTFGGVMGAMLKKEMAVMECILSGFVSGIIFGLFSGQPLNVLSATGPVLIFETLFYKFCKSFGWLFLPARFWLGFWVSIQIIVLVACDASFLVAYITRFTEENFATLIAVIFIVEAFQSMIHLAVETPITIDHMATINDPCHCVIKSKIDNSTYSFFNISTPDECISLNGTAQGSMCNFVPDVFLFSVILFFATFTLATCLQSFKTSSFFPAKLRTFIADFAVFLSIIVMTLVNYFVGLKVETLHVPNKIEPTQSRSWIINPMDAADPWWIPLACFIPALLLTVLIVMDQQITAVIVNRKDNKLKKGYGYHLDLLLIGVLVMLCSALGLPYFVAATILSISHVQSLKVESECTAPGEKPLFLGVREQRVTTVISHIFIGLSVFLTTIMRLVPMPVLLGVFLYMGVSCLSSQQFVQRIKLFFMPVKHQPEYTFLKLIPLNRVHLFTGIQLIAFIILCAVKYTKQISMMFPILLIVLVGFRKCLDCVFTQQELVALDDLLPPFRSLRKGVSAPPPYNEDPPHRSFNYISNTNGTDVHLNKATLAPLLKINIENVD